MQHDVTCSFQYLYSILSISFVSLYSTLLIQGHRWHYYEVVHILPERPLTCDHLEARVHRQVRMDCGVPRRSVLSAVRRDIMQPIKR